MKLGWRGGTCVLYSPPCKQIGVQQPKPQEVLGVEGVLQHFTFQFFSIIPTFFELYSCYFVVAPTVFLFCTVGNTVF